MDNCIRKRRLGLQLSDRANRKSQPDVTKHAVPGLL